VQIVKLMRGFPSSQSQITEGNVDAYLDAVMDCSLDAVTRSVTQFLSGKVDGRNNGFLPTAPELSANARQWDYALSMVSADRHVEKLVSYPMGALPPPPLVPLGPIKIDFGEGMIDMTGMNAAEKAVIMESKGQKRLGQGDDDPRPIPLPALRRM
jgi:hypothetical protein